MTREQCWELYFAALNKIKECSGLEEIRFINGCGGNVVSAMLRKAQELGL